MALGALERFGVRMGVSPERTGDPVVPAVATPFRPGGSSGLSGTVEVACSTVRLVLRGELDLATTAHLDDALRDLLAGGMTSIVIDLRAVVFADCAGLRPLRCAAVAAERAGGAVRVEHPTPLVARVLRLTDLEGLLARAGGA